MPGAGFHAKSGSANELFPIKFGPFQIGNSLDRTEQQIVPFPFRFHNVDCCAHSVTSDPLLNVGTSDDPDAVIDDYDMGGLTAETAEALTMVTDAEKIDYPAGTVIDVNIACDSGDAVVHGVVIVWVKPQF